MQLKRHGGRRLAEFLPWLLLAMTLARMALLIAANPIVGYANNFDFIRQAACVGLWEDYGDRDKHESHPSSPVNRLINDRDIDPGWCLASVDNVFPFLVAKLHRRGAVAQLRQVGLLKFILAAAVLCLAIGQLPTLRLRVALAAIAAGIFGDIDVLSYMNTMYAEFSLVLGLYAALALTLGLLTRGSRRWWHIAALAACLAWLGFCRQQYAPLATLLGLACGGIVLIRRWGAVPALLLAVIGVVVPLVFQAVNARPASLRAIPMANRIDTYFGAVLPEAGDPARALRILGLPASCGPVIGQNWFSLGTRNASACPAATTLPRTALLALFLAEPRALFAPFAAATRQAQPTRHGPLARFERPGDAQAPLWRWFGATSLSWWLAALPPAGFLAAALTATALGLVGMPLAAILAWRGALADPRRHAAALLVGIGGFLVFYAIASSIFGDGFIELQRHAMGIIPGFAFLLGGLGSGVFGGGSGGRI